MRRHVIMLSMLFLSGSGNLYKRSDHTILDTCSSAKLPAAKSRIVSTLCIRKEIYRIFYDRNAAAITLMAGDNKVILQRIPRGYDPALVGAENLIGFLPDSLETYAEKNILVSVSAIRTNGGGGGGQCGAGSEVYLNFIDIGKRVPKLKSRILVDSCNESIEMFDKDAFSGVLGAISVVQNNISLHFMNYKNFDGSPTAVVAPDFTQLIFK